jgi:hypothetical protein
MPQEPIPSQRPPLLSLLCVAGLVGCFLKMILVISPPIQGVGPWYPAYLSASTVVLIICLCGLWLMKRWVFFLFIPYVLLDQWVYWHLGRWAPISFVLMGSLLAVSLIYHRRFQK